VWNPTINKEGRWMLQLVKRLNHADPSREDGANFAAPITCVLPRAQAVYTGDDEGRVFEWECVQRGGILG
jgi:beige protein homolog 1